jgi:hypothetical protein
MSTAPSLRVPAWLVGVTAALWIAAAVRVVQSRSSSGLVGLLQVLVLIGICLFALFASFRVEDLTGITLFPSRRYRRGSALALIAAADFYLAVMLLLGSEAGRSWVRAIWVAI